VRRRGIRLSFFFFFFFCILKEAVLFSLFFMNFYHPLILRVNPIVFLFFQDMTGSDRPMDRLVCGNAGFDFPFFLIFMNFHHSHLRG